MDISEVKSLIEDQGRVFAEFKQANDALMRAKAEGRAVGDLVAKVERLNAKLDEISEAKSSIENTLVKLQRQGLGFGAGGSGDKDVIEAKSFHDIRVSQANGRMVHELSHREYQDYKSGFCSFLRKGRESLSDEERKAMQAGSDPDGGYMLPPSTIGRAVAKLFELSPIRQIAAVQPISSAALEGLYDNDEASYGWVGETAARPDTNTPTLGKYRIEAFEMYAMPKATQTLLDDAAVDVEAWLADKVANKFARVEAAAFINGTGVNQPRGFATYTTAATADATRAWGTIEHVKTTANGDFAASNPADKLFDLIAAFKNGYLPTSRWVTTREVMLKVRKFKEATTNAYIWQPGLQAGQPDTLLGYPIVIAQDLPALATDSLSMWFGSWIEAYQIVDRIGFNTLRDPYTDKPYVKFYSTRRVGGAVVNFEAIKALKFSA